MALIKKVHHQLSRLLVGVGICLLSTSAHAKKSDCAALLTEAELRGATFLHQQNQKLHTTFQVTRAAKKPFQPAEKIGLWIKHLERSHQQNRDDSNDRIKKFYHRKYVVGRDEIPESYFETQVRLARELGHGNITLDAATRKKLSDILIRDQQSSLDQWIDYFRSEDSKDYPMWAKVWAFNGMLKLGIWDPEKNVFNSRTKNQTAPFAELNHEALGKVMGQVIHTSNEASTNFARLYAEELAKLSVTSAANAALLKETDGKWITYQKGSSPEALVQALAGKNTGWCTAAIATAKTHLKEGDFHVYFSKDASGNPTLPRVAIRMEGDVIQEVRGVAKGQNLDSEITSTTIVQAYKTNSKRLTPKEKSIKRV